MSIRPPAWSSAAADAIAAFLFPQGCHVCGGVVTRRADGVACGACWDDPSVTPLLLGAAGCERCGAPGECGVCVPEGLTAARAAGIYAGALRAALLDLKRRPVACARLRSLIVAGYEAAGILHESECVVPVPLHPRRQAERGHNQAAALAEAVAKASGLESIPRALSRRREAPPRRAGADRTAREATVRGAFAAASRLVDGRVVLLVDDVYTTGSTLGACATALRSAGAREVYALTAARARD